MFVNFRGGQNLVEVEWASYSGVSQSSERIHAAVWSFDKVGFSLFVKDPNCKFYEFTFTLHYFSLCSILSLESKLCVYMHIQKVVYIYMYILTSIYVYIAYKLVSICMYIVVCEST